MKQHDIKQERILNGNTFYVRPFGAFKAVNLSGEIFSLLIPIITGVAPVAAGANIREDNTSVLDIDIGKAAPYLSNAMNGINGDRIERLLKKLLIQYRNISVAIDGESAAQLLTEEIADEVFCGDAQDMFILAYDVIRVNYSGFFEKVGDRFGGVVNALLKMTEESGNTVS